MNKLIKQAILEVTGTDDAEKFARMNGTAAKIAEKVLELVREHSIGKTTIDYEEADD